MKRTLTHFWSDEDGATLVEYGIALIIGITVGGGLLMGLAGNVNEQFTAADEAIEESQE